MQHWTEIVKIDSIPVKILNTFLLFKAYNSKMEYKKGGN